MYVCMYEECRERTEHARAVLAEEEPVSEQRSGTKSSAERDYRLHTLYWSCRTLCADVVD